MALIASGTATADERMSVVRAGGDPTIELRPVGGTGSEITVEPGDTIVLEVFLSNFAPHDVRGYEVVLNAEADGGLAGSIVHDGTVPFVDVVRQDYAFSDIQQVFSVGRLGPPPEVAAASFSETISITQSKYAGTFTYVASDDARGNFTVGFPVDTILRANGVPASDVGADNAGGPECQVNADCDPEQDVCTFEVCVASACASSEAPYGDISADGVCGTDGAVNLFDILAMLDGFQGIFVAPCSHDNFDISAGGACGRDGAVDVLDIFAVLDAFAGDDPCGCVVPSGPAPVSNVLDGSNSPIVPITYIDAVIHIPGCVPNASYSAECDGTTASILLDVTGPADPDKDTMTFSWTTDCSGGQFDDSALAQPTLTLDGPPPCPVECTVTLSVDDGNGGTDECTSTVTVEDTTSPEADCPPDELTVECDETVPPLEATATDDCDDALDITSSSSITPGSCVSRFTIDQAWEAADTCGNIAICNRVISVEDATPPTLTCPEDIVVDCADNAGEVVDYVVPTATDNCNDTPIVTCDPPAGIVFAAGLNAAGGTTTVTCTADDGCDNATSCDFDVTLIACGACCSFNGSCEDDVHRIDCVPRMWSKGISCAEVACIQIPTVSEWTLIVMTLIGCTVGTLVFRGRRQLVRDY